MTGVNQFFTSCALQRPNSLSKSDRFSIRNWYKGLFIACLTAFSWNGYSQGNANAGLGFTVTFSKSDLKIGDTVELIFKAPVPANFHVYSEKSDCPADDGPIRAEFRFDFEDAVTLIGGTEGIGDVIVNDTEVWKCSTGEFAGTCEFRQKVRIDKEVHGLVAHFTGQRCSTTDGICFMINEDIKIPLEVSGK